MLLLRGGAYRHGSERAGIVGGAACRGALHGSAWRRRVHRARSGHETLHDLRRPAAGLPRFRARVLALSGSAGTTASATSRMQIKSAEFRASAPNLRGAPTWPVPEFAFIGRSNV